MTEALAALAPIFLVPIGAVLVSLLAQQAITFSGEKLQPKLSRLSLLANAKTEVRRGRAGRVRQGRRQARGRRRRRSSSTSRATSTG